EASLAEQRALGSDRAAPPRDPQPVLDPALRLRQVAAEHVDAGDRLVNGRAAHRVWVRDRGQRAVRLPQRLVEVADAHERLGDVEVEEGPVALEPDALVDRGGLAERGAGAHLIAR